MKILKFEHQQARQIASGKKWSTWRLFDDKDLSVGDEVEFIDKVQDDKPKTWEVIGLARINKVVEKRLYDISDDDMDGDEFYRSPDAAVRAFQRYYGPNVALSTPVKMVYFDFMPTTKFNKRGQQLTDDSSQGLDSVRIFADGGSRGNPGPSASGYVLEDVKGRTLINKAVYLGKSTNNQAEYLALRFALEEAKKMGVHDVDVFMDSLLVINQMNGKFKVRNRDLQYIHAYIKSLSTSFKHVTFTHIPREMNKLADAAVNRALDAKRSSDPRALQT